MFLIRFAIANPLLTNLLLVIIAVGGIASWRAMPQEMFPLVELDKVSIRTIYEGASPEEVEKQVTIPIEQEFDGMAEIDVITSLSSEGLSVITIDLKSGTDIDDFVRDADAVLDRITDLPEEAEQPDLTRLETRFPVISLALYGSVESGYLYRTADDVKRRLLQVPGVASVGVAGIREWELWVVVDPQRLATFNVPLTAVTQALRNNLRDLPGGSISAAEGDILLRGKGTEPTPEAIANVVLRANEQGGQLRLGQVAQVERRLQEPLTLGRFNGQPSVNLTVNKTAEASTIDVADTVRTFAAELEGELPRTLNVGLFSDFSVYVKNRLETVESSALVGLVLVLISLYLFLNFRVALVTAMGIPVSFLIGIILINYFGYTINMISLFAFLIALGMIVDDAIIVNENIYRHMEMGKPAGEAAEIGSREVFWPVMASTATTIAAFLPMFAIGGTMGAFIAAIPAVVTFSLLGSLWEAFGVLPSHAAEMLQYRKERQRIDWDRWLGKYQRLMEWTLINRYFVTALTIGILLLSLVLAGTRLPFQLFGNVSVGQFFVNAEAPITYSLDDTEELATRMEQAIYEVLEEDKELNSLLTNVGVTFVDFNTVAFASNRIQLIFDLKPQVPEGFIERWVSPVVNLKFSREEGTRTRSAEAIINAVRQRLQTIAGVERLSILRPQGGPGGADLEIGVSGPDIGRLNTLANEITDHVKRLPGTRDIRHNLEVGKLEYRYTLNERGRQLGLTQFTLAEAVRAGFQGLEVVHVAFGDERIPVRVIYPETVREQAEMLERLPIVLASGRSVYLGDVAEIEVGRGLSSISRRDLQRLVTITGEVDDQVTTPLAVTNQVTERYADFEEENPGYELKLMGEKQEANESIADMVSALILALMVIFIILAVLFKSLLDPLVVMISIPFAFIGVIIGHWIMGHNIQFLSLIGFLALAGIVVNDSLILVDFAKRARAEGKNRHDALIEAGRVRSRPIFLTSVTTFLGISPLIFFATGQTAFLAPMAVSLGFGLLFATVLILVAIPCFYLIADDLRVWSISRFRALLGMNTEPRDGGASP